MWGVFLFLFLACPKEVLFLVLWRVLKKGLLTFVKCLLISIEMIMLCLIFHLTGKEFWFYRFPNRNFFFFCMWLESTVLDYDDFITLRISCKIFAPLFISEIDFIWFWSWKYLWSIIITWFFQKKKIGKGTFTQSNL